jgi:hypothetical protein
VHFRPAKSLQLSQGNEYPTGLFFPEAEEIFLENGIVEVEEHLITF